MDAFRDLKKQSRATDRHSEMYYEKSKQKSYTFKTKLGQQLLSNPNLDFKTVLKNHIVREPQIIDYLFRQNPLKIRIFQTAKVSHTLRSGKIYQFRVVAGIGNSKGVIGLGVGKSRQKVTAVKKAINNAKKNVLYIESPVFDLFKQTTKTYNGPSKVTVCKNGATKITVSPLTGSSITASKKGKAYCELGGLINIKICVGTKKRDRKGKAASALNYFTALHDCMRKQNE
jgi:small subunit ribosomal protein S5